MNSALYKQYDSRWGSKPYPTKNSTFAGNGCGCCACTHLIIEQDRYKDLTPEPVRKWMVAQGFAAPNQGTSWDGIKLTLEHYGYKVVHIGINDPMSKAWAELDKGNRMCVILFLGGKAPNGMVWTAGGHYVAFPDYYVGDDGRHYFYSKDSGGRDNDSAKHGYYSYERSMAGLVYQMWIVERINPSPEPTPTPPTPSTGKYSGPYPNPKKYLEKGDKGTEVTKLQNYLNWYFDGEFFKQCGEADGIYGNNTLVWTKKMQTDFFGASEADGKVGAKTIAKMKEVDKTPKPTPAPTPTPEPTPTPTPTPEPTPARGKYTGQYPAPKKYLEYGDKGTEVKKLQQYLNWYNNYGLSTDGNYGADTYTAAVDFQEREIGLGSGDGKVGPATIAVMKKIGDSGAEPSPRPTPKGRIKGMDISTWQGKRSVEDFIKAKESGIQYVILRVGFTGSDSKKPTLDNVFENNYANAVAAGLPIGYYYYSLATTEAMAKAEAEFTLKYIKSKKCDFPVYIDMEDGAQSKASSSKLAAVCNTFCNLVNAAGYEAGVYANVSWFNSKIGNITAPHTKWVAQYYKECQYKGAYDMWQYTSDGVVPGMGNKIDLNWYYKKKVVSELTSEPVVAPSPEPVVSIPTSEPVTIPVSKTTNDIIATAESLAWPSGTASSKYAYNGGAPTKAFKAALDECYPTHNNWGAGPKVGASCDVGVGTVMRCSGIDTKYPRGISEQKTHTSANLQKLVYTNVKPIDVAQAGDAILYTKNSAGTSNHTLILGNGCLYEAQLEKTYFHKVSSTSKLNEKRPKVIIFRPIQSGSYPGEYPNPKKYLEPGDKGTEVTKLQKYIDWFFDGEFFKQCGGADGTYGNNTLTWCKKMQVALGYSASEADGKVGPNTIAKMKAYKKGTPEPTPTPTPTPSSQSYSGPYPTAEQIKIASNFGMMLRAAIWAEEKANSNKYGYRPYDSKNTKCYFCHPELMPSGNKIKLASCIGWASQFWHHGANIVAMKCSQNWVNNAKIEKALKMSDADCLEFFKKATGLTEIRVLRNGGKVIPWEKLKRGMICFYFSGNTYEHTYPYIGDKMMIDSGSWSSWNKQIAKRSCENKQPKIAIEFTGGLTFLQLYDRGDAVTCIQNYIDWYFDGVFFKECGPADGIFGSNTEKWVKKLQTALFGAAEADGFVGPKTIEAMKQVKK